MNKLGNPDDIEQERPAIELSVDGAFFADRRDDIVEHVFRDVVVPGFDDIGLDHRAHFHERRLADINIPGAFTFFRLGDETLDTETLDRRNLIIDTGEFGVNLRDARMQVLDPLIERRGQRAFRACRPDTEITDDTDPGQTETSEQGARHKLAARDFSAQ
jgi:hypothetical protein